MTIALVLLAGLTVCAQGKWRVSHRQADPMKNQDARDVYIYDIVGVGSVVIWDWDKADFRLVSETRGFYTTITNGATRVYVKAGIYDENGELKKMYTLELFPEDNTNYKWITTGMFYYFGRGGIRKVMKHMKSGKGYVRFLAELYNNKEFDIKVTPYQRK